MRRTLIRLTVLAAGLLASGATVTSTAHADPVVPLPEPTFAAICPQVCVVPEPEPEPEINCPPFCIGDIPQDLVIEDPCPPDLCGPFPPDGGDEGEGEPTEEPTPDEPDQPTDPDESTDADQPKGGGGSSNGAGGTASGTSTPDAAEPVQLSDAEISPVDAAADEPARGGTNAALLAALATGFGLLAGGGLAYTVLRRR